MNVQEFLKKTNIEAQADLIIKHQPDYEEPYDKDKVMKVQKRFVDMLLSLTPIKGNNIIIFEKTWVDWDDEIKECVFAEMYEKNDVLEYLKNDKEDFKDFVYDKTGDSNYLEAICDKVCTNFPQAYAYEFSEWERILGWQVIEPNDKSIDIQECIYAILYEMSFNGMTRDSQQERRDELEKNIKEIETLKELPEEEQKKHFFSFDEVMAHFEEEFGITIEPETEDEKEKNRQRMFICSIETALWKHNNFDYLRNNKNILY